MEPGLGHLQPLISNQGFCCATQTTQEVIHSLRLALNCLPSLLVVCNQDLASI